MRRGRAPQGQAVGKVTAGSATGRRHLPRAGLLSVGG
jgi:hypothetical protein